MRKLFGLVLLVAIVGLVVFFLRNYEVQGLEHVIIRPRDTTSTDNTAESRSPGSGSKDSIRIGSFNIEVFGSSKFNKPHVMEILVDIVRQMDVVAIQEIRSKDQTLVPRFVEMINRDGRRFEYIVGPPLGRTNQKEQYAFVFDSETILIDNQATYTVSDPYDRLHREPLVALFRARIPASERAFTFKLVNVHTDPDDVKEELNWLDDVYWAVRDDGDGEDDIIILGDLNSSEKNLYQLGEISGIDTALTDTKTNTAQTHSYDNIVFRGRETNEFNGRAGVVDLLRTYNITKKQAEQVSDHFPIWAEFSTEEGGPTGRVAGVPGDDDKSQK